MMKMVTWDEIAGMAFDYEIRILALESWSSGDYHAKNRRMQFPVSVLEELDSLFSSGAVSDMRHLEATRAISVSQSEVASPKPFLTEVAST